MTTPRFRLHHYPASRSARVKWILHEVLDEDFDLEIVSLYDGEQYSPTYLDKNPNHCVPTLEITMPGAEPVSMIESGAMVAFLADAFPDKGLAPAPSPPSAARADYLQMLHFGSTWMDMMLWQIRVHEHLLSDDERDEATIRRYREKFTKEAEPQLRQRLVARPFVCAQGFTAADCVIGHDVLWARAYGLCQDDVFRGYLSQVSKRPAFLQAFADASAFQPEPPAGSEILERFTG